MITKEMTIEQILSNFPKKSQKIAQELTNTGLQCVGCGAAVWETLEAGMLGHGMDDELIDSLVVRINQILSEPDAPTDTISMTVSAAEKFQSILKSEKKEGWALRFGDKPGGCGGYEYILDFSEKSSSDDQIFTSNGVEIFVNNEMVSRLLGSEIDYVDGLMGGGFKVSNPNTKSSCSCGSSQSY